MSPRSIVISLHDVHPGSRALCARILGEFAALGVDRCSLLVVPDFHRQGAFVEDGAFCEWIAEQARRGHEIVAHGYHHLRPRAANESVRQMLTTRIYTADEGEFFDLDRAAAAALLLRVRDVFGRAGLAPTGFIAPAWLLSPEAEEALREEGWEYTTRLRTVSDLHGKETVAAQSLVWSVRSRWRRRTSLCWNAFLHQLLAPNPLGRVSVHPADVEHPAIWRQIRALVSRALVTRRPATYQQWIRQHRAAARGFAAGELLAGTPSS